MSNSRLFTNNRLSDLLSYSGACRAGAAALLLRLRPGWPALRVVAAVLICGVLLQPLAAQTQPHAYNNQVASDPIKCWWRTDKSAVEVGEHFTLTLTCGVDTEVVPKMEQLEPETLQLAPFDVLNGTRHDDVQAPPWRYFQYEYTLRLIGQDFFGEDVAIPALTVTYNIQSAVAGASEGRDKMYVLPVIPIHIMSLVPQKANDIRDSMGESFAAVKARFSRATAEFIAAGILFGFGMLTLAFAGVRVMTGIRERGPGLTPVLPERTLMRACLHEILRLESEVARAGWTPDRTGSALTIFRIGSAVAMGHPVAQMHLDKTVPIREGQLAVGRGLFKRERMVVSAATTPQAIERYRVDSNGQVANGRLPMINDLGKSLCAFSAVRYGRDGSIHFPGLDLALKEGRNALRRLRRTMLWPMRAAETMARSATTIRNSIWTR